MGDETQVSLRDNFYMPAPPARRQDCLAYAPFSKKIPGRNPG